MKSNFRKISIILLLILAFGSFLFEFSLRYNQKNFFAKQSIEIIKNISKVTILQNPEKNDDGIYLRIYPSSDGKKLVDIYVSKKEDINNALK